MGFEKEIAPSLTVASSCGGGVVVIGVDLYNQAITGLVSKSLNSAAADADHVPVVVIKANAKAYGLSSLDSNAMKSPNPYSGIYEAQTSRTLDNNGGNPACNQGGIMVLQNKGAK